MNICSNPQEKSTNFVLYQVKTYLKICNKNNSNKIKTEPTLTLASNNQQTNTSVNKSDVIKLPIIASKNKWPKIFIKNKRLQGRNSHTKNVNTIQLNSQNFVINKIHSQKYQRRYEINIKNMLKIKQQYQMLGCVEYPSIGYSEQKNKKTCYLNNNRLIKQQMFNFNDTLSKSISERNKSTGHISNKLMQVGKKDITERKLTEEHSIAKYEHIQNQFCNLKKVDERPVKSIEMKVKYKKLKIKQKVRYQKDKNIEKKEIGEIDAWSQNSHYN